MIKVMSRPELYDVTEAQIDEALAQEQLYPGHVRELREYRKGGALGSMWIQRIVFSDWSSGYRAAKQLAGELEEVENYVEHAFHATVRDGRGDPHVGLTVEIRHSGYRMAGRVVAIGPEDFTIIEDNLSGERHTFRYEQVRSPGHYNRKD